MEIAGIEKCYVDRFHASFNPFFPTTQCFFQKYFEELGCQFSWRRKINNHFHKSDFFLMLWCGFIIVLKNSNFFHGKVSSIYLMVQPHLCDSSILTARRKVQIKLFSFILMKKKNKAFIAFITFTYWMPAKCDVKDFSYLY